MKPYVLETDFPDLKLVKRGKVRDIYDLGDTLLMVMSDRISAFDVIMPNPVPGKGRVLTQISLFWFKAMQPLIENHLVASDIADYPAECQPYADDLFERTLTEEYIDIAVWRLFLKRHLEMKFAADASGSLEVVYAHLSLLGIFWVIFFPCP